MPDFDGRNTLSAQPVTSENERRPDAVAQLYRREVTDSTTLPEPPFAQGQRCDVVFEHNGDARPALQDGRQSRAYQSGKRRARNDLSSRGIADRGHSQADSGGSPPIPAKTPLRAPQDLPR